MEIAGMETVTDFGGIQRRGVWHFCGQLFIQQTFLGHKLLQGLGVQQCTW